MDLYFCLCALYVNANRRKVGGMATIEERVSHLEADVENLKGWQRTQNGTLGRIEQKVDGLIKWIMATAVTFALGIVTAIIVWAAQGAGS